MSSQDDLIDKIDMELFRVLRMAHDLKAGRDTARLIEAIRYARTLSEALLPDSKRWSFEAPPVRPFQELDNPF